MSLEDNQPPCVELGVWTPVPDSLMKKPSSLNAFTLHLKDVDPRQAQASQDVLTFQMTGCSASFDDHTTQQAVADAMASQIKDPMGSSINTPALPVNFLYLLGDVVYKPDERMKYDQGDMYNQQFYTPYASYNRPIFAIAGNHDGKIHFEDGNPTNLNAKNIDNQKSALPHFLRNFCAYGLSPGGKSPDNGSDNRHAMTQPYIYWRLETHQATIIGLYSNVANGGMLDDPGDKNVQKDFTKGTQYQWLVEQLNDIKTNTPKKSKDRKAVLLTLHYPPYSGTASFSDRGDPTLGLRIDPENLGTPVQCPGMQPLAIVLEAAFAESMRPDAVFSAHAHLYQRLTYRYTDSGKHGEIPFLVVGSGGHTLEGMGTPCNQAETDPPVRWGETLANVPFPVKVPLSTNGKDITGVEYNDTKFGFLRVTIKDRKLIGEYFTAYDAVKNLPAPLKCMDTFTLDLDTHTIK